MVESTTELSPLQVEYEQYRNIPDETRWCNIFAEKALSPHSSCRNSIWSSFAATDQEFPGCTAYHAYYQTAEAKIWDGMMGPAPHLDFWVNNLRQLPNTPETLIWIPATATARMPHIVRFALPNAKILITDICPTVIESLQEIFKNDPNMVFQVSDAINPSTKLSEFMGKTDAVVSDAFATRFDPKNQVRLYGKWYEYLKSGGFVLTTIRKPNEKEQTAVMKIESGEDLMIKTYPAVSRNNYVAELQNPDSQTCILTPDQILQLAQKYVENMASSHGTSDHAIYRILMPKLKYINGADSHNTQFMDAGFHTTHITISKLLLDITPREYLQFKAIK